MKLQIHSADELKVSRGHGLEVTDDAISISVSDQGVKIQASENEVKSSQAISSSGPIQDITRRATVVFSPKELAQVLDVAIKANLLRVSFTPSQVK